MRRLLLTALTTGLLVPTVLLTGGPALAHPGAPVAPTLPTDLTYAATDNVEYLGRFPEHSGTAGGTLSGTTFFLTDPRGVHAYDATKPESPVLLDSLPLYQSASGTGAALAQEDPDTDGRVLLVDGNPNPLGTSSALQVVDVRDPSDLKVAGTLATTDHTWECVTGTLPDGKTAGCAYAYGRSGGIVDLTDPAKPVLLANSWRKPMAYGDKGNSPYTHDLTEVRPGLVMSAGATNILMDTRNPRAPKLLNKVGDPARFSSLGYHSVEWARGGRDPFLVFGTEIGPSPVPGGPSATENLGGSDCEGENSVIETWSAEAVLPVLEAYYDGKATAAQVQATTFVKKDVFDAGSRGIFLTGAAPANVLYCAHWMEMHPDFKKGGLVTVSYYDRGTRFLRVDSAGAMTEIGWLVAAEGYSGSSQWISDDVVYVMDYRRGLEVVKLTGTAPATGVRHAAQDVIALGSIALTSGGTSATGPASTAGLAALAVVALLGANVTLLRRRRRARA